MTLIFLLYCISQEVKQSFSCSLNDSIFVKDMRWTTTLEYSYVVLSNTGQLYHGGAGFPLKHVMDSVEAGMLYSSCLLINMYYV
jgi:nuclear pore complex protein Nup214